MKELIRIGILENKTVLELREEIVHFKNQGGSQIEAQAQLEALRADFKENKEQEDIILSLLDYIHGWCKAELRIWNESKR